MAKPVVGGVLGIIVLGETLEAGGWEWLVLAVTVVVVATVGLAPAARPPPCRPVPGVTCTPPTGRKRRPKLDRLTRHSSPSSCKPMTYWMMTAGETCGMSLSEPTFASCTAARNRSVGATGPEIGSAGAK